MKDEAVLKVKAAFFYLFFSPKITILAVAKKKTIKAMAKGFEERYGKMPQKQVGDSGYGSEENYEFMQDNDIEAFVKYPLFHAEQKRKYKNNAFLPQNKSRPK